MTPEQIAEQVISAHMITTLSPIADTGDLVSRVAAALKSYGDERARAAAQAERERIMDIALAIHADYPTDVFPSHPAAGGARLAITRLIGKVNALD